MFFGAKKLLGLDIGTNSIKLAELDLSGGGAELVNFAMIPTPEGALSAGDIVNQNAVSQAVQGLIEKIKSKRKCVCLGMWGTSVIVKKITIPRVDKKLISKQISWEAEQYIPFDLNEIALDYHILSTNTAGDVMDVLLVAAQNAQISQVVNVVEGAKLNASVVDVSSFALANVFQMNYGTAKGKGISLVNIGANNTNFVVIFQGEVIFARDIPVGGASYTNEISKELGLSYREAEALKLSAGAGREIPEQVQSIISSTNDVIAEEIRNSFEFFSASSPGFQIEQSVYTGGASSTPNLIQRIVQATGVNFNPLNPFQKIKTSSRINRDYAQQIIPFAAVALGLGLRKENDR